MLNITKACFIQSNSKYKSNTVEIDSVTEEFSSPRDELLKTGSFFPGRPYVRKIGTIKLSKENQSQCNHQFKTAGRLGAGTLLFWCGRHRNCIGFTILQSAESSQTVYSTILGRFKKIPKYIIYDNGCNLYDYILNRSPNHFKESYVVSDGFHWKNHINCGSTFNAKIYKHLDDVSTVLHEQKNALIHKLKRTSVHMNFDTFCEFLGKVQFFIKFTI
ncbi:hypothetical protein BC833DRAFT_533892 [Globomyces pollinis-pini]|nr:hypothetical protein BC833DRAFT_533892 [Globomyces pollinis-pini]